MRWGSPCCQSCFVPFLIKSPGTTACPAVKGTTNVLEACVECKVKGVVVVSSVAAVIANPEWKSEVMDESCWSDKDYCRTFKDETPGNEVKSVVDVRDVAAAILMLYEKPEAEGRYICRAFHIKGQEVVDILTRIYPAYKYPKIIDMEYNIKLSSEKLERLGWTYRTLEKTLVDSVECYRKAGLLPEN